VTTQMAGVAGFARRTREILTAEIRDG